MFYSIFFICLTTVLARENCDKKGVLIYEDLGCIPEKPNDDGQCPEKYNCVGLDPSTKNCVFNGKVYENGENVDAKLTSPSCKSLCTCNVEKDESRFICASASCSAPALTYPPRNCYTNYSLSDCCLSKQICEPFDDIATCEVDGKTYKEGERFSPENTCLQCVCQKGFTGKLEAPFCRKQPCAIQLSSEVNYVQRKCAPIYTSKSALCCPYHWACADGTETIVGTAKSDNLVCQFGDKLVKKGQTFEKTNITSLYGIVFEKVECECDVPPLARCLAVNIRRNVW